MGRTLNLWAQIRSRGAAVARLSRGPSIAEPVQIQGVGIHTGRNFRVSLRPGTQGVRFLVRQQDLLCEAPALWTRLSGTARSTALVLRGPERRKVELRTIEHFMAAVLMSGLRNLDVEVEAVDEPTLSFGANGGGASDVFELPVLDGSARQWMDLLASEALMGAAPRSTLEMDVWIPRRPLELVDGNKRILISPHPHWADAQSPRAPSSASPSFNLSEARTRYTVQVDFGPAWRQEATLDVNWLDRAQTRQEFSRGFAGARTFGFEHELESLRARGLAQGAALENALLLNDERVVNAEGFRVPNELAAHKLLDAVGDFALLGAPVLGQILCVRAGHSMHLAAVNDAVRSGALGRGRVDAAGKVQLIE